MIKQEKDYIKSKKKKHLLQACLWGGLMIVIFIVGLFVMKERANTFTLIAALLVLPFALHLTRYFSYAKYKDPSPKQSTILERMKGTYALYHSVIMPDSTGALYFAHVVVTSRNIYFMSKDETMISKAKAMLANRLKSKGIQATQLKFIHTSDATSIKNAALKIQKDACFSDEQLGNNTKIIDSMIM